MTLRAHRDAVIASLQTDLPGAVFKSYSAATATAPPLDRYAVVFLALTGKERSRYTGPQRRDTFTVTVHCVADNEDSCLWVQERVDLLTDRTLLIPGRNARPVEYITGQPPELDDDGTDPLWFTISQFDIVSDPA